MQFYYVYFREFYPVYEPAEGGYYVQCSRVTNCVKYLDKKVALRVYDALVDAEIADGELIHVDPWTPTEIGWFGSRNDEYKYSEYDEEWEDEFEWTGTRAWTRFGYDSYIGHGFAIEFSEVEPQDEPYEGYC